MTAAQYAVIRYVPEPSRNEPVNIGIVVWASGHHAISIDQAAFGRVLAGNPDLDKRAYDDFADYLMEQLSADWPEDDHQVYGFLTETVGFPMAATEPLPVRIDASEQDVMLFNDVLERCADRLLARLVKLRYRQPQMRRSSPHAMLKKRLAPWLATNQVAENYPIRDTNSGIEREVSFYANSGANVALELVTFPPNAGPDAIVRLSDAAANKARDVLSSSIVNSVVVCLPLDVNQALIAHAPVIHSILAPSNTRMRLEDSLDDAETEFLRIAGKDSLLP